MSRDEIEVDSRLRRALAHAPDASVEPPQDVDAAILHAARAAIRPSAQLAAREPPGLAARLKRWWTHPALAPALVVATLSTVIVSMWTRHELPPNIAERQALPEVVAEAPADSLTGASTASRVAQARPVKTEAPPPAASPATFEEPKLRQPVEQAREQTAAAKVQANTASRDEALALSTKRGDSAGGDRSPAATAASDRRGLRVAPAAPAAAPPPTADPAVHRRAEDASPTRVAEARVASAPVPASPAVGQSAPPAASAVPPTAMPGAPSLRREVDDAGALGSAANLAAGASLAVGAAADVPPYGLAQVVRDFTWLSRPDRAATAQVLLAERGHAWLSRLVASTQSRWKRSESRDEPEGSVIDMRRGDATWATVTIGATSVTWVDSAGRRWEAQLPIEALDTLRNP